MNDSKFKAVLEALIAPLKTAIETIVLSKENVSNKVTDVDEDSTDTEYPSAKCLQGIKNDIETAVHQIIDLVATKESKLNKEHTLTNSPDKYPASDAVWAVTRREPTLINTITVNDDTTSTVEISLDSDGNAFSLKNQITIYVETPIASEALILYSRLQNQFALIFYSATSTTNALINKGSYAWNGYEWSGNQVVATATGVRGTINAPTKYFATDKEVKKVEITTNNNAKYIPNGTVIKVYGENYA